MTSKSARAIEGLYSVPEAAFYLGITTQKLHAWVKSGENLVETDSEGNITFLGFVHSLAILDLRKKGVSLQKIREAVRNFEDKHEIDYVFAREHNVFIDKGSFHIFISLKDESEPEQFTGKKIDRKQRNFTPIIMGYLKKIEFDKDGLAETYNFGKHSGYDIFCGRNAYCGQPVVKGTHHTVGTLCGAVNWEGDKERAASAYGVELNAIEAAMEFEKSLRAA